MLINPKPWARLILLVFAVFAMLIILAAPAQPKGWTDSGHAVWSTTTTQVRDLGECIRQHESYDAGHYRANNPTSTASGAYQFIQSTFDGNAEWAKVVGQYVARKYVGRPASSAPPWVQDAVFIHSIKNGGIAAWKGTGCPGTGG